VPLAHYLAFGAQEGRPIFPAGSDGTAGGGDDGTPDVTEAPTSVNDPTSVSDLSPYG
jgi:hypothetical protein